jgi:hypothetical protein
LGPHFTKFTNLAYADDVTVIVSCREDVTVAQYERATGAKIGYGKSKAFAIEAWDCTETALGVPYVEEAKILGINFQKTIAGSTTGTWTQLTNSIRGRAQEMRARDLNLIQRIHVVHTFLLSKIWYVAQTVPTTRDHARQITMSALWFIWQGETFKVPTSTLHRVREEGALGLTHVKAKCSTLFITRLISQRCKQGTVTAESIDTWRGYVQEVSLPNRCRLPPP